jgi:hypothetical protein
VPRSTSCPALQSSLFGDKALDLAHIEHDLLCSHCANRSLPAYTILLDKFHDGDPVNNGQSHELEPAAP